jgi:hypothetical protein
MIKEEDLFDLVAGVQAQIVQEAEDEGSRAGRELAKKQSYEDGRRIGKDVRKKEEELLILT